MGICDAVGVFTAGIMESIVMCYCEIEYDKESKNSTSRYVLYHYK
jgi:hypothetical protein